MSNKLAPKYQNPVEFALSVLNGKWKASLIEHLEGGPLRFGQLRARMPRLSDKILVEKLRELEERGFVERCGKEERGRPHTAYRLSSRGLSLLPVYWTLERWGEHMATEFGIEFSDA